MASLTTKKSANSIDQLPDALITPKPYEFRDQTFGTKAYLWQDSKYVAGNSMTCELFFEKLLNAKYMEGFMKAQSHERAYFDQKLSMLMGEREYQEIRETLNMVKSLLSRLQG